MASSSGSRLRVFDVATGREAWATEFKGVVRTPGTGETLEDLSTVVFSPDGTLIAVGSTNGSVYLVSAKTGEVVRQM